MCMNPRLARLTQWILSKDTNPEIYPSQNPYAPCLNWLKNSQVSVAENVWLAPFITGVWL